MTQTDDKPRFGAEFDEPQEVAALVDRLGGALDDAAARRIVRRIVSPEHAAHGDDLVVVTSLRSAEAASRATGVLLCHTSVADRFPDAARWVHAHALWVVAKLLPPDPKVNAASAERPAWIDARATVDPTAIVASGAMILAGARIGRHSVIREGAVVYERAWIGDRVVIGPMAVVGRPGFGWTPSPSGELVRVPQPGGVIVEDDVEIGALATIDAGTLGPTILRRGVKLDAHVHVAHNVEIGSHTLVAAQAGFAGSASVGAGVLVGGQAGITDHAKIGAGARIGAKSGVIGDIPAGTTVAGFPALPRVRWLRAWAKLMMNDKRRSE